MRTRWSAVGLGIGIALLASAAQAQLTSVAVGPRPESITRGWNGRFFVSIQGPSGTLGVLDGEVREVDLVSGTVTPFVTGLENPRGITFTGKYLVVADQLKIYRIDQKKNVVLLVDSTIPGRVPFPVTFFNDAAAEEGGKAVYITEMGRRDLIRPPAPTSVPLIPVDSDEAFAIPAASRIYRVTMDGHVRSLFEPSRKLLVTNGVTEIRRREKLLAVDFFFGNVVKVDLRNDTKTILATGLRGADGVEQATDGTIYVSSFEKGGLWKMDADGENLTSMLNPPLGFQTTADFYLDEPAGKIYLPVTPLGTILIVPTE